MAKTRRFYIKQRIYEGKVRLEGDEIRHFRVLRLKKGDQVEVLNSQGEYGLGTIKKAGLKEVEIDIQQIGKVRRSPILRVLACCAPKNKRFDMLLQKTTELGIDEFIPIISKRSVVKPSETKINRLKKIIIEAAKQSGRNSIPKLNSAITVEKLMDLTKEYDLKIILDLKGKKIKEVIKGVKCKKIICLIGPEGGFTDEEIKLAKKNGFKTASLGSNILRVETAGIVVLSTINYEFNC